MALPVTAGWHCIASHGDGGDLIDWASLREDLEDTYRVEVVEGDQWLLIDEGLFIQAVELDVNVPLANVVDKWSRALERLVREGRDCAGGR